MQGNKTNTSTWQAQRAEHLAGGAVANLKDGLFPFLGVSLTGEKHILLCILNNTGPVTIPRQKFVHKIADNLEHGPHGSLNSRDFEMNGP